LLCACKLVAPPLKYGGRKPWSSGPRGCPTVNKLRMDPGKKRVGAAENPRSGVGARGSSVKKNFSWGKRTLFFGTPVLPLLNLLTAAGVLPQAYMGQRVLGGSNAASLIFDPPCVLYYP
jgi:hypothetical protein